MNRNFGKTPERPIQRRQILKRAAGGLGALALHGMLADLHAKEASDLRGPLSPKQPHLAPRAKNVIFLFMQGGVSQVESFDPKPKLTRDDQKPIPIDNFQGRAGAFRPYLKRSHFNFTRAGKCGTPISELFPHLKTVADDLCVIRSMETDHTNHYESTLGMHTGSFSFARPSVGSWVSFGLGTENQNLPSYVVIAPHIPYAGSQNWSADFLPGSHQGTRVVPGATPIANISPRTRSQRLQELELAFLRRENANFVSKRPEEAALEAQIRAFDTAFGMQAAAPDAFDVSGETDATLDLYGLKRGEAKGYGWQCLAARRLVERGVRYVELIDTGSAGNWDAHGDMENHRSRAAYVDQAITGLIQDLKSRGMLDDTLVVWTTEFGRTPYNMRKGQKGREHHHQCFSSWLAGGGVKGGITYGESDDYGIYVAENRVHVHDFHATILHLLGIDHEKLTFRHAGRDYRLTDVYGNVVHDIIA